MRDSSGIIGDPSGFDSGRLQLVILGDTEESGTTLGLNLMQTIEPERINQLLKEDSRALGEGEREIHSILKLLNIIPDEINKNNISEENIESAINFVDKLQKGSVQILENKNEKKKDLLILEATDDNDLLINAEVRNANKAIITETTKLLDISSDVEIETPIGELDFSIDTQGRDISVVNLQVPDNTDISALIKTVSDGTPHMFKTKFLKYTGEENELSTWLEQITYGVYYYSRDEENNGNRIVDIMPGNQTLAYSLIENGFEPNIIPDIDGSGYLIDTDNDGKADLISLMLVDQGWFDTRQDTIGLIGDPLTPISLRTVDEEPQDTNGTDPTTEDPEEPSSNGESLAQLLPGEGKYQSIATKQAIEGQAGQWQYLKEWCKHKY